MSACVSFLCFRASIHSDSRLSLLYVTEKGRRKKETENEIGGGTSGKSVSLGFSLRRFTSMLSIVKMLIETVRWDVCAVQPRYTSKSLSVCCQCFPQLPRRHFRLSASCRRLSREHLISCGAAPPPLSSAYLWFPKSAMPAVHKARLGGRAAVHHYHLHISVIGCAEEDHVPPTFLRTRLPNLQLRRNHWVLYVRRSDRYLLDTCRGHFDLLYTPTLVREAHTLILLRSTIL